MTSPFHLAELPSRPGKPRNTGITMVRDDGMPLVELRGILDSYGRLLDYFKFRQFVAWYLDPAELRGKIRACRDAGVRTFIGGTVLEAAHLHGRTGQVLEVMVDMELSAVEVSCSMVPLSTEELTRVVGRASGLGLEVLYEYGKKFQRNAADVRQAADDMKSLLQAGANRIIVERWQLDAFLGPGGNAPTAGRVIELAALVGKENLVFEAESLAHQVWLIRELGPTVNLGPNIHPFHVPSKLEPFRHGIGSEVGYSIFPTMAAHLGLDLANPEPLNLPKSGALS